MTGAFTLIEIEFLFLLLVQSGLFGNKNTSFVTSSEAMKCLPHHDRQPPRSFSLMVERRFVSA